MIGWISATEGQEILRIREEQKVREEWTLFALNALSVLPVFVSVLR